MRPSQVTPGPGSQEPTYSPGRTLTATVLLVGAVGLALAAVAEPLVAVAVVGVVLTAGGARRAVRRVRAVRRRRRRVPSAGARCGC